MPNPKSDKKVPIGTYGLIAEVNNKTFRIFAYLSAISTGCP